MNHIFISHVENDADVALEIALALEEAGYTTWCYEVDSIPGPSYLLQTGQAVEQAKAVILVISLHSLSSRQITKEVVRAHESGKEFLPVLRGISHAEFQRRQPEWREAVGAAASINIPSEGMARILPRIADGLKALGILPRSKTDKGRIEHVRLTLKELHEYSGVKKGGEPAAETKTGEPGIQPESRESESSAVSQPAASSEAVSHSKPAAKVSFSLKPNISGLLSYLLFWISGIIFLLINRKDNFVRFHAWQSIITFGILTIPIVILDLITIDTGLLHIVLTILYWIIFGFALLLWVFLMFKAYKGQTYKLPGVGSLAERLSSRQC